MTKMRIISSICFILLMLAGILNIPRIINSMETKLVTPPKARKLSHTYNYHGDNINDDYYWLRDHGWPDVKDAEVLEYLKAENAYMHEVMGGLKDQAEEIFKELKGRIKLADSTVPVKKDQYYYYSRTEENSNYPIICRQLGSLDSNEEVILDANKLATGFEYFNLGAVAVSPDHKLLVYSADTNGGERYNVYVKDLAANSLYSDQVKDTFGDIIWHENGEGFFYARLSDKWRPEEIYYHKLGTDSKDDRLVFKEDDYLFRASVGKSADKKYILINSASSNSNETWYIDMADSTMTPKLFLKRREEHLYDVDHGNDKFYIRTNDQGKNFRLVRIDVNNLAEQNWQEIIPHSASNYITDFCLYKGYLAFNIRENGLPVIKIINLADNRAQSINYPDPSYEADINFTTYDSPVLRFNYSSLNTPDSVMEYNLQDQTVQTLKVKEIPSGYNKDLYISERLWVESHDGVKVPVSLVYRKDLCKKDGSNPLYLYGYGSYGYAVPAKFRSNILTLLDRGFVYAIAHIRGGDDLGYYWYEDGKLLRKKNSFYDFMAAAEHLVKQNYTSKGNIVISGGSAGGMLMGVCVNERPELYKAAIMDVPFVDVLNTMFDDSLPLTPPEFKEWGNPKDQEYYNYIKTYSPYENIKKQNYPHMYVQAGLNDPRVTYWEPAKWVAKLREVKTDNNILLLETNMDAGHAGASGRFGYLRDVAKEYNFIFKLYGNFR